MNKRPVTIQEVAKTAKVSAATVSRVLSKPGVVSEQTRQAVLQAIQTTGYRVNQAARNLRMQRAGAVLVLVPNLGKPFYSGILAGISEGFAGSEYSVLITDTERDPILDSTLVGYFLDGRIDGAIALDGGLPPSALNECVSQGVGGRIVFLCEWVEGYDFPVVTSDNAEGARQAIRHLHDLGHRHIAQVKGPADNVLTTARADGADAELDRLQLPRPEEWTLNGDFTLQSGQVAAKRILAMAERPTAVFCAADMVAFGLISEFKNAGVRVPEDISVVGFDDIDISEFYVPSLTTIRQNRHGLGVRAALALRDRLSRPGEGPATELPISVELIVRDSTAPPPS